LASRQRKLFRAGCLIGRDYLSNLRPLGTHSLQNDDEKDVGSLNETINEVVTGCVNYLRVSNRDD